MVRLLLPPLALSLIIGCAENSISYKASDGEVDTGFDPNDTDGEPLPPPGPEIEDDFLAMPPASTDRYVFIANAARDTVTRVQAADQAVLTIGVGRDPAIVQTTPDGSKAISFNRGDDSVSLIDAESMEVLSLEVRDNFNTMEMSPDGRFVLLWHDVNAEREDDPPSDGLQSYNEISVVDLINAIHTPMAVGFNPRDVAFTPDGLTAVVVSDDALSRVDLSQSPLQPPVIVPLSPDVVAPPPAEEVVIEPAGTTAFVRRFGADTIQAVDLLSNQVTEIPVGAGLTDMDLSPDGRSLALVCRTAQEIWVIRPTDLQLSPVILPYPDDLPLGALSFSPTGDLAILYTSASPTDRYIRWNTGDNTLSVHALVKPVRSLSISPTGEDMLVVHTREDAPDAELGPFFGEWALTLIDLELQLPTPMRLPAEPIGFANAEGGRYAYFIMENEPFLEVLDYRTRLYEEVPLRSTPVWVGSLPDPNPSDNDLPYGWVSQIHDLGRISFYDPDDGAFETLTGFELNAAIED